MLAKFEHATDWINQKRQELYATTTESQSSQIVPEVRLTVDLLRIEHIYPLKDQTNLQYRFRKPGQSRSSLKTTTIDMSLSGNQNILLRQADDQPEQKESALSSRTKKANRFALLQSLLIRRLTIEHNGCMYDPDKPPMSRGALNISASRIALAVIERVARLLDAIYHYVRQAGAGLSKIVLVSEVGDDRHSTTANRRTGFAATKQCACTCWLNPDAPGSLSVVAMLAGKCHRNAS